MWSIFFISLLFMAGDVFSMEKTHYSMHGMHSESVVRLETMWFVVAANDKVHLEGAKLDEFFDTVRARLIKDRCMLADSLHSGLTIILYMHCPYFEYSEDDEEARDMKTVLLNTNALLLSTFGRDDYDISADTPNNAPKQWLGTYKSAGMIMRGEHKNLQNFQVLKKEKVKELHEAQSYQSGAVPWHLDRIDMRQGMANHEYMYMNDGANVDVYILDSGIRHTHTEFEGRAHFLYSTVRDGVTSDCGSGHGTHVAGIIGSKTYGVAKKVSIFAVRVLDCDGGGTARNIVEGVDAVLNRTLRSGRRSVINLSIGGNKNTGVDFQVRRLRSAGVVVVAAAGNEGDDACDYSPSNLGKSNYVLTVGASDRYDNAPSWSNYGECVSLLAPGVSITSLGIQSDIATTIKDGSSMASPSVAGAVAILLDQDATLSVERVNSLIVSSATPVRGGAVLYSLINLRDGEQIPPPPLPVVVVDIPHNSAEKTQISTGGVILCVSITLLWIACIV